LNAAIRLKALILRSVLGLALVMAVAAGPLASLAAAPADVAFTVNNIGDIHDSTPDGVCDGGWAMCARCARRSRKQRRLGIKSISFDSGMANQTIYLSYGPLTISTNELTIDGTTSGGDIILDAGGLAADSNLFEVQGNSNTLRGLMLQGWPDVRNPDADHGHGVRIYDPTGSGLASSNTLDGLRIYGFEHSGILISGDAGGGDLRTITSSLIARQLGFHLVRPGERLGGSRSEMALITTPSLTAGSSATAAAASG
jgi:hypothetical protein